MEGVDERPGCILTLFIGFVLISAFVLGTAEGAERLFGVVSLLMFGGLGTSWAFGVYVVRKPGPARNGFVQMLDGTHSKALVIPMSAARQKAGAVGLAFVSIGCAIIFVRPDVLGPRYEGYQWAFGAGAIALLIGTVSVLRDWRHDDAFIAFTPDGIYWSGVGSAVFVRWESIAFVGIARMRGTRWLGIDAVAPDNVVRTGSGRLLGRLDNLFLGHDVGLPLAGLAIRPDEIVHLASHYFEHPEERSHLGVGPIPKPAPQAG